MRKRGEWPSAERSDTRGCGSRIAPTGASEARSRYPGDTASRRGWRAKDAGASPRGTVAKPRVLSTRRTRPEVPRAALFRADAGRNPRKLDESRRTATRRHICICRAVARTRESAISRGIPRRPKGGVREADALAGVRARLPETKPHTGRQTSTEHYQVANIQREAKTRRNAMDGLPCAAFML